MKEYSTPKVIGLILLGLAWSLPIHSAQAADDIEIIGKNCPAAMKLPEVIGPAIWRDPLKSIDARVRDLVGRMSLAEKTSQLRADAIAIPRLGIPAYSYRNECLHGVKCNNNTWRDV